MITPKENFLNVIMHKDPVWTPSYIIDCAICGFGSLPGPSFEKGPIGGGYDGFGLRWIAPESGGGAPIPAPNEHILTSDDIVNWREYVTFPDLAAFDWESYAAKDLAGFDGKGIDRNRVALDYGCGNGPFERLAALMGFEEALLAMALEPDATLELIEAIVDWKIEVIPYVKKYINPDTFTNYDDVCTEKGPFMSVDMFRKMIKPGTKRLYDAVKEAGMIPIQHTCGFAEPFVEDFIEMGAECWTSVQACNDIDRLLTQYGDRLTFMGGWDSNGPAAMPEATDEEIEKEVHRCFDEYGNRRGFIFFGFRTSNSLDPQVIASENARIFKYSVPYAYQKAGIDMSKNGL